MAGVIKKKSSIKLFRLHNLIPLLFLPYYDKPYNYKNYYIDFKFINRFAKSKFPTTVALLDILPILGGIGVVAPLRSPIVDSRVSITTWVALPRTGCPVVAHISL
jgi:hypothetical protein